MPVPVPQTFHPGAPAAPRLAWLFDIDGTLLLTGGASREAFSGAMARHFEIDDDLSDIAFAGRTEPLIIGDILAKHQIRFAEGDEPRFWDSVFANMQHTLVPGRGHVLPGVIALLEAIEAEPAWVKGLLTGNMTRMAAVKLEHYGLAGRFAFGAFGEEAADRNELACLAVARVHAAYGIPASRCVVIGDTLNDIACARAAGAKVVAVATGSEKREVLEAAGADLVLDDLREPRSLLEWAREVAETR